MASREHYSATAVSMKKHRACLIGCGEIANAHAKAYLDPNLKIAAIANINKNHLKESPRQ